MALNVLIVDDSGVMRAMIIKTLRMTGLPLGEIVQAGNGQEGLDALNANWIDLVIADINMPVMNGEEMIDRMKANPETNRLPTVVVSTEGSETRIDRLQAKGVRFVHKPFTPETIRDTIQEITGVSVSDEGDDDDTAF
jgi:two-component system, chemotaxis family, chemotaxis protein CheY